MRRHKVWIWPEEAPSEEDFTSGSPLILLPDNRSKARGLVLRDQLRPSMVLDQILPSSNERFVVQRQWNDLVGLNGKPYYLRVFALLRFQPLNCTVFPRGSARQVLGPCDHEYSVTAADAIKNAYARWDRDTGNEIVLNEFLDVVCEGGYDVSNLWGRIEHLISSVHQCFAGWDPLATAPEYSRLAAFVAFDLALVRTEAGLNPLLVEIQNTPLLGSHQVRCEQELLEIAKACVVRRDNGFPTRGNAKAALLA